MKKVATLLLACAFFAQGMAQTKYYTNPILAGFYPDPSICRVNDDYYLVNSSFAYFPGLPIFHSKDLVNWKQIGHALDRPEQLNLDGAGVSRGLFAPAISYHKGLYYIVCTLIDKMGNFVITAKDPRGPWSLPVPIPKVNGIDPSIFFDDNDSAYLVYNSIPPNNVSLHNGHRTIRMVRFDWQRLAAVGNETLLVNGGTDMAKKPVWIEAPHIFKKDGWYFLICAEGGTGFNHSEVVFRSRSVQGPFEPWANNPILTQRHLDSTRPNPITTTGHAEFVETKDGKWYAVYLGCRPYEGDYYNTGRETFMSPVTWEDGWPSILKGNELVQYKYPVPMPSITKNVNNPYSGNVKYRDDFNTASLNERWIFLRTPRTKWYDLSGKKGFLSMDLQPGTCGGRTNPSFVAYRQLNLTCTATTSVSFTAGNENEKAGLVAFQSERNYYFIAVTSGEKASRVVNLYKSTRDSSKLELLASKSLAANVKGNVRLQIKADKDKYSFYYATGNGSWQLLAANLDGKFLSTKDAGGFVGTVFGLYATSSGAATTNKAVFDWFEYKGDDAVFKK